MHIHTLVPPQCKMSIPSTLTLASPALPADLRTYLSYATNAPAVLRVDPCKAYPRVWIRHAIEKQQAVSDHVLLEQLIQSA